MQIKGSIALVTGAAKGIGLAFCTALLKNGAASVRIIDICINSGLKAQENLEAQFGPGTAEFIECDVCNREKLSGIIDEKNWPKSVELNLMSVIHGTYIGMEEMSSGVIVNVSSMGGLAPISVTPVYSAAKHGVIGFTRSIAPVAHRKGIRAACICPVFTDTPLLDKIKEEMPQMSTLLEHIGVCTVDQIAEGFLQLLQDDEKVGGVLKVTAKDGVGYEEFKYQGI
ncbi:15-hydroxyprostaglandin dehydrogenase [NAD(+)] isoform X2 [Nematostella vectensis]|uniref:15-hydroxyprostaglandin dehydrogenase [NAD(+)] isoform X2 n=1 Tax=Nematostella vectensis TaxID=45351 RepID=UPI0020770642|nr:15-hydroxyprostaglandin dehydrogenase [NAD(+)] isoform X2 [Nematostella vectensis]